MKKLTAKQSNVLECIKLFISINGFGPTCEEIRSTLGYASGNSVTDYLKILEAKGHIRRTPKISRSIVVLQA